MQQYSMEDAGVHALQQLGKVSYMHFTLDQLPTEYILYTTDKLDLLLLIQYLASENSVVIGLSLKSID